MKSHRRPRPKVSKQPAADNPDAGILIERLYGDLVELEGIAITADEAVTMLPPFPSGKHKRTMRRLFVLVGATAGRASAVLERSEDMIAQLSVTRTAKRSPARRPR